MQARHMQHHGGVSAAQPEHRRALPRLSLVSSVEVAEHPQQPNVVLGEAVHRVAPLEAPAAAATAAAAH
eukprot:scaffold71687_cov36-Phaeocystis_antarctica.AAC.3